MQGRGAVRYCIFHGKPKLLEKATARHRITSHQPLGIAIHSPLQVIGVRWWDALTWSGSVGRQLVKLSKFTLLATLSRQPLGCLAALSL
ncbi:hypothetical protein HaLaN_18331 [Haematococcus lacustris]|uniref:Uncharacterized protein n=1 Tax=Haematococcus lacustris TaxID=44745 RepID=A0A699ZQR3_HAELA|nr:hypothetical protein HaLaN_18331 [Haematococcus lacustris]